MASSQLSGLGLRPEFARNVSGTDTWARLSVKDMLTLHSMYHASKSWPVNTSNFLPRVEAEIAGYAQEERPLLERAVTRAISVGERNQRFEWLWVWPMLVGVERAYGAFELPVILSLRADEQVWVEAVLRRHFGLPHNVTVKVHPFTAPASDLEWLAKQLRDGDGHPGLVGQEDAGKLVHYIHADDSGWSQSQLTVGARSIVATLSASVTDQDSVDLIQDMASWREVPEPAAGVFQALSHSWGSVGNGHPVSLIKPLKGGLWPEVQPDFQVAVSSELLATLLTHLREWGLTRPKRRWGASVALHVGGICEPKSLASRQDQPGSAHGVRFIRVLVAPEGVPRPGETPASATDRVKELGLVADVIVPVGHHSPRACLTQVVSELQAHGVEAVHLSERVWPLSPTPAGKTEVGGGLSPTLCWPDKFAPWEGRVGGQENAYAAG